MGARVNIERPKHLVDKYGENFKMWSYSNVSSLDNCTWEYYLSRVLGKKGIQNIYSECGGLSHDILENFYNGEIKYEDMLDKFEADFLAIEMGDFRFHADNETNEKRKAVYRANLIHFFKNHVPVKSKVLNEKCVWIDLDGHVFIGYVDAIHKDEEGSYVITDYKTSSINEYKGKKQQAKAHQLLIYALGLMQMGKSIDEIKARWNFLKYTNVKVTYKLKSGEVKTKEKIAERIKWVDSVKSYIKKDLIAYYKYEEWEADIALMDCLKKNSISHLPKEIQANYILEDAYVYIDITEEHIEELKEYLLGQIESIKSRNWKSEKSWEREPIKDSFYCSVLCGQKRHCKYYSDYIHSQSEVLAVDQQMIAELDELMI